MPGYSKLALTVPHDEEEKYKCIHCRFILRDPRQNMCGHRFCFTCIEDRRQNSSGFCPACFEEGLHSEDSILCREMINHDYAIKREMRNLPARCNNDGCGWCGVFQRYMNHELECEYAEMVCSSGCTQRMKRRDLKRHIQIDCVMRLINCEHCDTMVIFKEIKIHERECTKFPVTCRFCLKQLPRDKLQEHTDRSRGNCARDREWCKFHDIGCNETVERGKEVEHGDGAIDVHMQLLLNEAIKVKSFSERYEINSRDINKTTALVTQHQNVVEILRARVEDLDDNLKKANKQTTYSLAPENSGSLHRELEKTENTAMEMKTKIDALVIKARTSEGVVAVLSREVERSEAGIRAAMEEDRRDKERLEAMVNKLKAQDKVMALKDVTLAEHDLQIQSLEMAGYCGALTWKIADFASKRRDAISGRTLSLFSPYFFTSRFGYKMCARVYLNGDGMGKGNHVSLFFVVMKGEYDAILRWPFRQKVTFMWIDQNNKEHVIDAFRPDPNSSSFKRPTSDLNTASGCPLFLPLSLLDSDRSAYVKDDVAFLRISVDTSDL
ncbi:TNF receptor-associated factor 2-like [Ptychodera flava]|uniref:TNF receptor-associated factor 2-like n=1 Tax=Ptychodera flava TaxID=63121 RepID=UPI00396A0045